MNFNFQCSCCGKEFETELNDSGTALCPHCNSVIDVSDVDFELPEGYVLGGFVIKRQIGKGGSGNVYLATQTSMHRDVALKVLLRNKAQDKASMLYFLNEVKALGRVQHKNIVPALDAGESQGLCYLAMQYVHGKTLESILEKNGTLPEGEALKYVIDIAKALQYVWDKYTMYHRDIKPGNIIIDDNGEPVLLDMGIAQTRGDTSLREGKIEGSPFYMSPEQIQAHELNWSTDLYSLGATLYHMLVGVPPYDDHDDVMKILEQHVSAPFPAPESRNPNVSVSPQTVDLLRKMLEKDPKNRFESWEQFISSAQKTLNLIRNKNNRAPSRIHQKKKQFVAKKTALPSSGKPPKKTSGKVSVVKILNLFLFLLLGTGVAYYLIVYNNTRNADKYYQEALVLLKEDIANIERAFPLLAQAHAHARQIGVRSAKRAEIDEAYSAYKKIYDVQVHENELVGKAVNAANDQYKTLRDKLQSLEKQILKKQRVGPEIDAVMNQIRETVTHLESLPAASEKNRNGVKNVLEQFASLGTYGEKLKDYLAKAGLDGPEPVEMTPEEASAAYTAEVNSFMERLSRELIVLCSQENYDAAEEAAVTPSSLEKGEVIHQNERKRLDLWVISMQKYLESAKFVSKRIASVPDNEKTSAANDLLLESAGYRERVYAYFLLNGRFVEAKRIANITEQKELSEIARAYLKWRLQNAVESGNRSDLEKLDKQYGSLPEYRTLKEEFFPPETPQDAPPLLEPSETP